MATKITTSAIGVNNNETYYEGTSAATWTEYQFARNQKTLIFKNTGSHPLHVLIDNADYEIMVGEEKKINQVCQSFKTSVGTFTVLSENDIVLYDEVSAVKAATANLPNKKFKIPVGIAPYWLSTRTNEYIDNDIKYFNSIGLSSFCFYINVHITEGQLTMVQSFSHLEYAISKCNINCIKFHFKYTEAQIEDLYNGGLVQWKIDYKALLEEAMELGKDKVKYFTVLNEAKNLYFNNNLKTYVIELLDLAKSYGYKTGVSVTRADSYTLFDEENNWINNEVDAYFVNLYTEISNKEEKTTLKDSVNSWNVSLKEIKNIRNRTNKPLIISETGIMDYWESLYKPEMWDLEVSKPGNGEVPYIYYYGLFNSDIQNYVDEIWLWYPLHLKSEKVQEIFKDYLIGG